MTSTALLCSALLSGAAQASSSRLQTALLITPSCYRTQSHAPAFSLTLTCPSPIIRPLASSFPNEHALTTPLSNRRELRPPLHPRPSPSHPHDNRHSRRGPHRIPRRPVPGGPAEAAVHNTGGGWNIQGWKRRRFRFHGRQVRDWRLDPW